MAEAQLENKLMAVAVIGQVMEVKTRREEMVRMVAPM